MKTMPRFSDIEQFTSAEYEVDQAWSRIEGWLEECEADMDPDFQRGHVWTPEQRTKYIEFCLHGGQGASDIYWNSPGWNDRGDSGPVVIVDGKQRVTAVRMFLRDEVPIFGSNVFSDYEDTLFSLLRNCNFRFHVNDLKTRSEVIEWYLELNAAGTPHTSEELARVRALLLDEE